MAMCDMAVVGLAPCQCFSPGGIHTVSPGLISRTGPPQVCTRPSPATTWRVWPSGWVCHAVRAPGSKLTRAARMRAGAGASMIGSCHTVPVNQSPGMRRDGTDPNNLMSMIFPQHVCTLSETATASSPRDRGKVEGRRVNITERGRSGMSVHERAIDHGVDHLAIMPADRAGRLRHEHHHEVFPGIGPPVGAAGAGP